MDSSFSNYFTNVSQPIDIRGQSAGLVEIIVNDCIVDGGGSGSGAYVGVSSGVVTITDSIFKNTYFAATVSSTAPRASNIIRTLLRFHVC